MAYRDSASAVEKLVAQVQNGAEKSAFDYAKANDCNLEIGLQVAQTSEGDYVTFYEEEKENTLKNELKKLDGTKNLKIGIIIGPEGGIDKTEVEKLAKAGAKVVTLGKRILRTETASISIMSNIVYEFEL